MYRACRMGAFCSVTCWLGRRGLSLALGTWMHLHRLLPLLLLPLLHTAGLLSGGQLRHRHTCAPYAAACAPRPSMHGAWSRCHLLHWVLPGGHRPHQVALGKAIVSLWPRQVAGCEGAALERGSAPQGLLHRRRHVHLGIVCQAQLVSIVWGQPPLLLRQPCWPCHQLATRCRE